MFPIKGSGWSITKVFDKKDGKFYAIKSLLYHDNDEEYKKNYIEKIFLYNYLLKIDCACFENIYSFYEEEDEKTKKINLFLVNEFAYDDLKKYLEIRPAYSESEITYILYYLLNYLIIMKKNKLFLENIEPVSLLLYKKENNSWIYKFSTSRIKRPINEMEKIYGYALNMSYSSPEKLYAFYHDYDLKFDPFKAAVYELGMTITHLLVKNNMEFNFYCNSKE